MNKIDYAQALKKDFPSLEVNQVKIIGEGWDHVALEVNDSIIFRIPRGEFNVEKLAQSVKYETSILKRLRPGFPVSIPDPAYIAPNHAYFGYTKLPGEILGKMEEPRDEQTNELIRQDWVTIAVTIHNGISLELAKQLGVPKHESIPSFITANAQRIFDMVVPKEVLDFAQRTINAAKTINSSTQNLSFIHGDLHGLNLLIDPSTKRITGVIDWTDMSIAPIEREFSVWEWDHDNQLEQIVNLYQQKTGKTIDVTQARTWRHIEELSDFVEQTEAGNNSGAQDSLNHIQKWIAEGK